MIYFRAACCNKISFALNDIPRLAARDSFCLKF
jgi:hypothetical protein